MDKRTWRGWQDMKEGWTGKQEEQEYEGSKINLQSSNNMEEVAPPC
ncbi:MAG: hypothetical protein LBV12_06765 [Puniceicoccales bacterium]|jgi:hypothetical protein|nr:hypothetical protein [Puniceicoccales bacterium]